jgi:hypothetical protein
MSASSFAVSPVSARERRRRFRHTVSASPAALVALLVLVVASVALVITHTSPTPPVARSAALQHAWSEPASWMVLSKLHITRSAVTPVDRRYEQLSFYDGARLVATVGIGYPGVVLDVTDLSRSKFTYGSNVAHDPRVLALLCVVFVLMTAVWPLWRVRNLDVVAAVSSVSAIVLFDRLTLDRMVVAVYPALIYLALRCGWRALGPGRSPAPSVPIYNALTKRWRFDQRRRALRLMLAAAALIVAMVGLSSLHVVDVGYAVMEGATAIGHGLLPYGHIPDVLHGDTYPLGSYLLYVPFAALSPVHSQWDDADFTLVVAVVAAGLCAWALARRRASAASSGIDIGPQSRELAGLRTAIAWLTFPPLLVTVSTGSTDVVLAAVLLAAVLLWRRPSASTAILAAGGWVKLVPLVLLPLWLAPLRGRALARALAAIAGVSAPLIALLLALSGPAGISRMVDGMGYQFTRRSPDVLWTLLGSVPLQQLAQAATLALIAGAAVRLRRDPALASDSGRIAALCAAVLLGVQISANYWTYMYLAWIFPFLALSVLSGTAEESRSVAR